MEIIVLNGSPKGEYSVTLQYVKYLQKKYSEDHFQIFHIAHNIKKIESDSDYFNHIIESINSADVVLWSFGLWVLTVSAQYIRFIELINERNVEKNFNNKYTAAISTSIHYYDHTAHNYIRAVCEDLKMQYVDGISFDMLDLKEEKERTKLDFFYKNLTENVKTKRIQPQMFRPIIYSDFNYSSTPINAKISTEKKVLILTDGYSKDTNLGKMIDQYSNSFKSKAEIIDLNIIEIKGSCLGCMKCGYNYQCQYKDGFKDFYNNVVRKADILIFAGELKGRYLSSKWKTFYDRSFFWNHTPSLAGKQIGYIISGPLSQNANLQQILEAMVTARQTANLIGIVTDESANSSAIDELLYNMANQSVNYAEKDFVRPYNFLGVGGHIIFRDNVWGRLRAVWQADHRYYKKHGWYNFPQKNIGLRIMNPILLLLCKIPYIRNKFYGNIMKFPSKRFGKLVDKILASQR